MMRRVKSMVIAAGFAVFVGGSALSVVSPAPSYAAPLTTCKNATQILTFPVWYRGLNRDANDCRIVGPNEVGGTSTFIWIIILNIIDIALNAVGYITVGYLIYGGFLLMIARGMPENITKARLTIRDAAVGLIISIGSVAIVNLIVNPASGIIK